MHAARQNPKGHGKGKIQFAMPVAVVWPMPMTWAPNIPGWWAPWGWTPCGPIPAACPMGPASLNGHVGVNSVQTPSSIRACRSAPTYYARWLLTYYAPHLTYCNTHLTYCNNASEKLTHTCIYIYIFLIPFSVLKAHHWVHGITSPVQHIPCSTANHR